MKLKLKNPLAGAPAPEEAATSAPQPPTPGAAPKLALKIKKVNPPSSESVDGAAGDAPKQKRKYTKKPKDDGSQPSAPKPKKRPLEDAEEVIPAKRKSKPTFKSLALVQQSDDDDEDDMPAPAPPARPTLAARTPSVKISLKPKGPSAPKPAGTAILKVKGAGKPPPRPPGVGYDSEADEAEQDPAIESQFVLRMLPGRDCDILRKAIEEKTIGKSVSQGGPGVHFRFLDREGRRTLLTIQGRMYAATMVELPCVIESLKSWNKKDWVKTADVCQMLLVLGEVKSEEEVKKYPRPPEVEPDSYRYPHGLTPPMYRVRKRRFRPRKSYLDVERIETNTEKLLQDDEKADDTKYELIESGAESPDEASSDEDAQGEDDEDMMGAPDYVQTPQENQIEADDLMQMLQDEFMADDLQVEFAGAEGDDDLFGGNDGNAAGAVLDMQTPATAHDVAMHALAQNANVVLEPESAASTPAAATSNDDDDDDDADDDDDEDPEAAQKQQQIEELKEQISELNKAIQEQEQKRDGARNDLWKKRIQARIDQQLRDLDVKRTQLQQLGETED